METIFLNYKDVQFIVGCTPIEAKKLIYSHLDWKDKNDLVDLSELTKKKKTNYKYPFEFVKATHEVDINSFKVTMNSFSDDLHGKPTIQLIVAKMRESGISGTMKHEVLEDTKNILRSALCGKWATLKKILDKNQVDDLESSLARRRALYLGSGNKIPKNLVKYAKLEM